MPLFLACAKNGASHFAAHTWGVPEIRGKVSQNACHCSKVNDISRQACLVYVNQIYVKSRILVQPCLGNGC